MRKERPLPAVPSADEVCRSIAELAKRMPQAGLTTLSHHKAPRRIRKDGAAGVDRRTATLYHSSMGVIGKILAALLFVGGGVVGFVMMFMGVMSHGNPTAEQAKLRNRASTAASGMCVVAAIALILVWWWPYAAIGGFFVGMLLCAFAYAVSLQRMYALNRKR